MKFKKTLLFALGIIFTYSCAIHIVNGTEYDLLQPEHQARIKKLKSFETVHRDTIYELTAKQLKADLRKQPKSIVYIFKSSCQGNYCELGYTAFCEKYQAEGSILLFEGDSLVGIKTKVL